MPEYAIVFARSARKELECIAPVYAGRILERIEELAQTPRPIGALMLKGGTRRWRIRIGDYRVVYAVDDRTKLVDVIMIAHRKDVYRDL